MTTRQQKHRRKLIKGIAAVGGIISAKSLPDIWVTPVVESVILPVHAQVSVLRNDFSATQGSGPLCEVFNGLPVPDPPPFNFSWPGQTPIGDGALTVTANGDINGNEPPSEEWLIAFNGTPVGTVGNTGSPTVPDTDTAVFAISLADLLAAAGMANVTATNGGVIDCDPPNIQNDVTVTLTFPATSP